MTTTNTEAHKDPNLIHDYNHCYDDGVSGKNLFPRPVYILRRNLIQEMHNSYNKILCDDANKDCAFPDRHWNLKRTVFQYMQSVYKLFADSPENERIKETGIFILITLR
jgi:hypothetical protein